MHIKKYLITHYTLRTNRTDGLTLAKFLDEFLIKIDPI